MLLNPEPIGLHFGGEKEPDPRHIESRDWQEIRSSIAKLRMLMAARPVSAPLALARGRSPYGHPIAVLTESPCLHVVGRPQKISHPVEQRALFRGML